MKVTRKPSSAQPDLSTTEDQFLRDRAAVVRLCASMTGSADVAEDLAQEALIEAWRNAHKLRDPDAQQAWLHGIARNVCRRWRRAQGLEHERLPRARVDWDVVCTTATNDPDDADHVERSELAALLLAGMAQLPPRTRQILHERYLGDRSNTAIAASLGMSESAVSVALHRGKQQLRQELARRSAPELTEWGIRPAALDPWQRTQIWCARCGQQQLIGHFDRDIGYVAFRCPACHQDGTHTASHRSAELFQGISGYKPALNRLMSY
jgi:RNA polymerase sigma-70 factor (ECF subfamily)